MTKIKIEWARRVNFQNERGTSTVFVSGWLKGSHILTLEALLFPNFVYMPQFIGLAPPGKREREGRPPRCSTSWKKGHHSVNFGPILTILGSKWPQGIDLSLKTVFLMWKWLESTQIVNWIRRFWSGFYPGFTLTFFPTAFWAVCSPFPSKNKVPSDRSIPCGHLEPKMAKIGPKLTKWRPFFWSVLHLPTQ